MNPSNFCTEDEWMTPYDAWQNVAHLLPKDKVIWEPFYGDGNSGKFLSQLGFNVIHKKMDFFENNFGDVIVSNPPFSDVKSVLERLLILGKPWVLLMSVQKLSTNYFRELLDLDRLQIVIPYDRVSFNKFGSTEAETRCPFDCYY